MHKDFFALMDTVCSDLGTGAHWHNAASNAFRKIACRGLARWSEAEACGDFKSLQKLCKLLQDKLDRTLTITVDTPQINWQSYKELPQILANWEQWERDFAATLTRAFKAAAEIDVEIYRFLICLTEEVEGEAMRIRFVAKNFEQSGYDWHHISRANIIMHDHYESSPDDQTADWNIG